MPFVICHKHGGNGSAAVCQHLAAALSAAAGNVPPVELFPVTVSCLEQDMGPMWYCIECATNHGIPTDGLHLEGEAGLERLWTEMTFVPVCRFCFEERFQRRT